MEKQTIPREQTHSRAGTSRTPDRWLWIGSLLFHLFVFMLLPSFITEAKQPLQLLIEIVKPDVQRKPVEPSGVQNPKPAATIRSQAVAEQPAKLEASSPAENSPTPASPKVETPAIKPTVINPALDEAQPSPSEAATTTPIPDMVAVPTHQPKVITPPADPVVEAEKAEPTPDPVPKQPAPIEKAQPKPATKQPTLPAPASSTGNTTVAPKPPGKAEDKTPDTPSIPATKPGDPAPANGTPATDNSAKPAEGEKESAGPPAPSALELGMLGDYGDGARKKIRMLVRTPELAREQGLKGKCKFEFELRRDGTLVGIKVLESSSHAVLDEECLEATRVAASFKRFPSGVSVDSWKFQMEIVFPTY